MQPEAIERPWGEPIRIERERRAFPRGTRIIDVLDDIGGSLLILGESGSGKTMALLELARDAIARAENDPTKPIPVVLSLSSWAGRRQPIGEWLVKEFRARYHVGKRVARSWIENDDLLLLLDDLDQVPAQYQEACVRAINDFQEEHGLVPIVVCGRIADRQAPSAQLDFRGAVLLQPLSLEQIDRYLEHAGVEPVAMREMLRRDPSLHELAKTPLMLNVITLAYPGLSLQDLETLDTVEECRRHVFDTYVRLVFDQQRAGQPYSEKRTVHWLSWLAQRTSQRAQKEFLVEQMQPGWLSTNRQRWTYTLSSRAIGGLLVGFCSFWLLWVLGLWLGKGPSEGATVELIHSLSDEQNGVLIAGAIIGLIGGLIVGFLDGLRFVRRARCGEKATAALGQAITHTLYVSLCMWAAMTLIALLIGGLAWLVAEGPDAAIETIAEALKDVAILGAMVVLPISVVFGLRGFRRDLDNDIQIFRALGVSWSGAGRGFVLGLLATAAIGLIGRLSMWNDVGPVYEETSKDWVITWLIGGVASGLIGAVLGGMSRGRMTAKITPARGPWLSARSTLFAGLAVGLGAWSLSVLATTVLEGGILWPVEILILGKPGWFLAIAYGADIGVVFGLIPGLLAALRCGGLDVIHHYILRYILCRNGYTPWNLARFLGYAIECGFLCQVSGGYGFVHQPLQEYFASLYEGGWASFG
jgi:hypothetical protein